LPGIPRDELLAALGSAAKVLDALHEQHGLAHLSLNPDNLQSCNGVTLIADYGVASLFWLPTGKPLGPVNPLYAAPELWNNTVHRSGDVYSLALIYLEMLTGHQPECSPTTKTVTNPGPVEPDLTSISAQDRAVLLRALD